MPQDSPGRLRHSSYILQKVRGNPLSDPSTYQGLEISKKKKKKCHFPTDWGGHLQAWGNVYWDEYFHSMPEASLDVAAVWLTRWTFPERLQVILLSSGGTCYLLGYGLWITCCYMNDKNYSIFIYFLSPSSPDVFLLYSDVGISVSLESEITGRKKKKSELLSSFCLVLSSPHRLLMKIPGIFQLPWKVSVQVTHYLHKRWALIMSSQGTVRK